MVSFSGQRHEIVDFALTCIIIGEKMALVKGHGVVDDHYRGYLAIQKHSIACRKELSKLTYVR